MSDRSNALPQVGIWRAFGDFRVKTVMWPTGVFALLAGLGGGIWAISNSSLHGRISVISDVVGLSGAFLAVIFTALTLVVALPSGTYLKMLGQTTGGMKSFLDPFLAAVGVQIATLILALGYRIGAGSVSSNVEHAAFCVIGVMFVFGVLDLAVLARQLVLHGIARAADAEINEQEAAQPEAVRLEDRRR